MGRLTGQTIKGYTLREMIGVGGFAAVYRAHQAVVDREVAIKVILPKYVNNPDFVRRFEAEAQLIARLEHSYIVPLFDFWREPNNAYLVMRWLRGGSLYASIQRFGPWDMHAAARLMEQIAAALTVAHRNHVIHQDLTPANILLDGDRNGYLTDFGIAKGLLRNSEAEDEWPRYGSPAYMAPEQVMGRAITPQTDIYSLGLLLFEVLTGHRPFQAATHTEMLQKQVNEPMPPLQTIAPNLPYALNVVILQATAKNAALRFPDVQSFAAAFQRAVEFGETDAHYRVEPADRAMLGVGEAPTTIDLPAGSETLDFGELVEPQNPYKGLRAFDEADAPDFFGRQALVKRLMSRLEAPQSETPDTAPQDGDWRFLAVVGPSGSGKSSVVKAGLIPVLRQGGLPGSGNWFVAKMVPGPQPFEELETALLSITMGDRTSWIDRLRQDERGLLEAALQIATEGDGDIVLVIDQFEEVFTLVTDEAERALFLNSLLAAVRDPASPLHVIITLRADFYDRPLLYQEFGELVRTRTEVVLPLTADELQRTIVGPATRAGLTLGPGLVTAIVADVSEQPGALPLLQYALTELFERRQDRQLALQAYRESGGVLGALARRAEELYAQMDDAHQAVTRQMFLRMVSLGEGADDTRRRVPWAELMAVAQEQKPVMQSAMQLFGKYRLITFDHDPQTRAPTAEVAHEALIREWKRLRAWLDESRDDLRIQRRLTVSTAEWLVADRDASFLATGARLVQFEALATHAQVALTDDETDYLRASMALRQRAARRLRLFIAALLVFSVLSLSLAAYARDRQQQTERAQATTIAERDRADMAARISRSGELAVIALKNVEQLDQALLLSLEALKAADTYEARNSLLTVLQSNPRLAAFLYADSAVRTVAVSIENKIAAGGADGTITIWAAADDYPSDEHPALVLRGHVDRVNGVAFSPDGARLVSGGDDGTIRVWDVATGEAVGEPLIGHADAVWAVTFSPDGELIASGSLDGTIKLWDAASGEPVGDPVAGHEAEVFALAFSPDGRVLASGGADNVVLVWEVASGELAGDPLGGYANWVMSVAFSPDGELLVSGSADGTLQVWDAATWEPLGEPLAAHSSFARRVVFSPDGRLLASSGDGHTVRLWDVSTWQQAAPSLVAHDCAVWGAAFTPDGRTLVTGGADARVFTWHLDDQYPLQQQLTGHSSEVMSVAFSPDGRLLASGGGSPSGGGDDHVRLWDTATGAAAGSPLTGHSSTVFAVAFSPDGTLLASGSADRAIILWDVAARQPVASPLVAHDGAVYAVAFSPDGQLLASGSDDGTVILWDVQQRMPQGAQLAGDAGSVFAVAFSPDGRLVAGGTRDADVIVWDVEADHPFGRSLSAHTDVVTSVAFSPDGRLLASGSRDGTVIVWDVESGQPVRPPLLGHANWVSGVTFSPDGRLLASGSRDGTVIVWDVETGQPVGQPLAAHGDRVTSVTFSSDGRLLASGSWDYTVGLWEIDLAQWQARACRVANRNLSETEWAQYLRQETYADTCPSQP